MALHKKNLIWKQILSVCGLWLPLTCQMCVDSVAGSSSGSSYFLFQQPEYPRDCNDALISCPSTHNASGVYLIKPDGFPEPFEVYCDNELHIGGWTVIQRRAMGSIDFNRTWEELKTGFGFLGSEFWLGNDKIAFLTHQKKYQLRMDFQNSAGQSYYVIYDNFRISDEYGEYSLSSLGSYSGTAVSYIEWCPMNTVFSYEACEKTCDEPVKCISDTEEEKCACVGNYKIHEGNCIPNNQCGCFLAESGNVLPSKGSYVNSNCTRRSNCTNNVLVIEEDYRCSDDATCDEIDGVRRCYCNDGFEGDGVTCTREDVPMDCQEIYDSGRRSNDVYTIYPNGYPGGIQVYCEMESNGGGWTIIQKRSDATLDFSRLWSEYKNGFGSPSHDHWLGNDYIHALTNQKTYQLRIDLRDSASSAYYAVHSTFSISNETDKYRLSVGSYNGNTGNDRLSHSNNKQFSTRDQDNDGWSTYNCAERHRGGWWFYNRWDCRRGYSASVCSNLCPNHGTDWCALFPDGSDNCAYCAFCHLNGDYDSSTRGTNIFWSDLAGEDCGIQYTDMKIRPV